MQKESLRGRTAAPLLAQSTAVSLITAFVVLVTAVAAVHNYRKHDAFFFPTKRAAAPAQSEPGAEEELPAVRQALLCWDRGDLAAAEPLLEQALRDAEAEPDPDLRYPGSAAVRLRLGMLCYESERYAEAKTYLAAAKTDFQSALAGDAPEILLTDGQLGLCDLCTGNEKDGWAALEALEPVAQNAESEADRMDACNLLARGCVLTEQTAEAVKWQEMLLENAEKSKTERELLPDYRTRYAELLLADGQKDKAAETCRSLLSDSKANLEAKHRITLNLILAAAAGAPDAESALTAAKSAYGEESHSQEEDAAFSLRIADACTAAGDSSAAMEAAKSACDAAKGTALEPDCLMQLGQVLETAAESGQALESYEKALSLSRQMKSDAGIAAAQSGICRICRLQGDYARSLEAGLEADKLLWKIYGKYSARRIPVLSETALSYGASGQFTLAKKYADAVRKIADNLAVERKESPLGDLTMGRIRTLENSGQSAIMYIKRAAEAIDAAYGTTHPKAVQAQILLGDACMRCREYEQANVAYGAAADRLAERGDAEETVSAVRAVQTATGGIKEFLAERVEHLRELLSTWDGT